MNLLLSPREAEALGLFTPPPRWEMIALQFRLIEVLSQAPVFLWR